MFSHCVSNNSHLRNENKKAFSCFAIREKKFDLSEICTLRKICPERIFLGWDMMKRVEIWANIDYFCKWNLGNEYKKAFSCFAARGKKLGLIEICTLRKICPERTFLGWDKSKMVQIWDKFWQFLQMFPKKVKFSPPNQNLLTWSLRCCSLIVLLLSFVYIG